MTDCSDIAVSVRHAHRMMDSKNRQVTPMTQHCRTTLTCLSTMSVYLIHTSLRLHHRRISAVNNIHHPLTRHSTAAVFWRPLVL